VSRANQLHAAFGDGSGGHGFCNSADFIDDDDFRHVILDGFDHYRVLLIGMGDLHAPRRAYGSMGNVAVAGDFIGGVDDDDSFVEFVRQHPGDFS